MLRGSSSSLLFDVFVECLMSLFLRYTRHHTVSQGVFCCTVLWGRRPTLYVGYPVAALLHCITLHYSTRFHFVDFSLFGVKITVVGAISRRTHSQRPPNLNEEYRAVPTIPTLATQRSIKQRPIKIVTLLRTLQLGSKNHQLIYLLQKKI